MMDIRISDIVISLNGRDAGERFFVVETGGDYAMLADGRGRRIEKPKRKKIKHLRFDQRSDCQAALKLRNGEKVSNSEIRRALAESAAEERVEKGGM